MLQLVTGPYFPGCRNGRASQPLFPRNGNKPTKKGLYGWRVTLAFLPYFGFSYWGILFTFFVDRRPAIILCNDRCDVRTSSSYSDPNTTVVPSQARIAVRSDKIPQAPADSNNGDKIALQPIILVKINIGEEVKVFVSRTQCTTRLRRS